MTSTNGFTIVGNLTDDPTINQTGSGKDVSNFTVAHTARRFDRETKEYVDGDTLFQRAVIWGPGAANFAASAKKGTRVIVIGTLKPTEYTDNDGVTRYGTELVVDEVGLSTQFSTFSKGEKAGGGKRSEGSSERKSTKRAESKPAQDDDDDF